MKKVHSRITIDILIILLLHLPQISSSNNQTNANITEGHAMNVTYMISGGHRSEVAYIFARYMVSIRTRRPQKYFGDNHFCAGTIIGSKRILTAAHCVMDQRKIMTSPRRLLVVAGSPNRLYVSNTTRQIGVDRIVAHMNYLRYNTDDIALIFLTHPLPKYDEYISYMSLPKNPPPYGEKCLVIGWGRLFYRGPLAARAVQADVILLTEENCKLLTERVKKNHSMLCTLDESSLHTQDPCLGDNGGPLFCDSQLTGIVSWTIGCGSRNLPSLYTDVYRHVDWILSQSHARHSPNNAFLSSVFILVILIVVLY